MSQPYIYASVKNCIAHLRRLGCEIDAALEQRLSDEAKVHHLLAVQMRQSVRVGWDWRCQKCGHEWTRVHKRGSRRGRMKGALPAEGCPECGSRYLSGRRRFDERRDGTTDDYRPKSERWQPLDPTPTEPPTE